MHPAAHKTAGADRPGLALGFLTLAYALNFLDRQVLGILLVPIQERFEASDTQMGLLAGLCFAALYTLCGIPVARLADRGSRRDLLVLGLVVWSGATLLCGAATSFALLAAARLLVGLGESTCVPAAHSLIGDLYPRERRAGALAVFSSGIHLGTLLAFALGGWVAAHTSWRAAFFVAGAPGLLLALVVRFALREPPRGASPAARETVALGTALAQLLRDRRFLLLSGGATLTSVVGYGFVLWNSAFLERVHHMQRAEIGLWLGVGCGLGGAAGTLGAGWLAQRLARNSPALLLGVPAAALALAIPCYAVYASAESRSTALAFLLASQVLAASWFGPVFAALQECVAPQRRALAASTLLALVTLVGLSLGPGLVGFLNDCWKAELGEAAIGRSLLVLLVFEAPAVLLFALAARRRIAAS